MISESFFSSNYTSVWRTLTPTMDEFVRRMNMNGYERVWAPLASKSDTGRRGLINEAAFILFSLAVVQEDRVTTSWMKENIPSAFATAFRYIFEKSEPDILIGYGIEEEVEALKLAERLYEFFRKEKLDGILPSPRFKGCGIISSCAGDVLVNRVCLYEIKSGDRSFRSVDYRQVAIYVSLHFSEHRHTIKDVCLLNPRVGIKVKMSVEDFARGVSGRSSVTFCQSLLDSFSASLASE